MNSKRMLLVKLRALGDTVLLSSSVELAKRLYPDHEIDLLIPEAWAELYRHDPRVSSLFVVDNKKTSFARFLHYWKKATQLRKSRYEKVLVFHASQNTARLGKSIAKGAEVVVHNHDFFKKDYYSQREIPSKNRVRPATHRDALVFEALGHRELQVPEPKLFINEEDRENSFRQHLFARLNSFIVLALGASRDLKRWPRERYAEVASKLIKEGQQVVAVGSKSEADLIKGFEERLQEELRQSFFSFSSLSLKELMHLLSRSKLLIGNDSGPRHLAAALGVKTVTIFGPEDPYEYHPYDQDKHPYLFVKDLVCRTNLDPEGLHPWCGVHQCPKQFNHQCMRLITTEKALSTIKKALS